MKIFLLLIMFLLISCEAPSDTKGQGENGDPPEVIDHNPNEVIVVDKLEYYNSNIYPTYNYYGDIVERSLGTPIFVDDFILPDYISVIEDSNSSLRVNDILYITINNDFDSKCGYRYNDIAFVFEKCYGDLSGFEPNDFIYVHNYPNPNFGVTKQVVMMLFGRSNSDLHTGTIELEAYID